MTADDFRRIALSFEGAESGSHMGVEDFRVGGHIFATLAHMGKGYGNLMLTPEQQADFVAEAPEIFLPVSGGWGKNGVTHLRLARTDERMLEAALRAAWKLRREKNVRSSRRWTGLPQDSRSATKRFYLFRCPEHRAAST